MTRLSAPVVDAERWVVGLVQRAELQTDREGPVAALMDPFVHKVRARNAIEAWRPILSSGTAHEAREVDTNRVLQGIITQADLRAVLYRAGNVEAIATQRAEEARAIDPATWLRACESISAAHHKTYYRGAP